MRKFLQMILAMMSVWSYGSATFAESMDDLTIKPNFRYRMQQSVTVDLTLLLPKAVRAGVVFYGESDSGTQLLQSRFTTPSGLYRGTMLLPSYLTEVTVQARYRGNVMNLVVPIENRSIVATLDLNPH
jgi:hypothetical protein